ncbi:hypothetical protein B2J93_8996 [Marssonina coronariae]|uniref:Uncharacterized protein n=1 Tax=Diplocarpon coronariae TaxID=2795749 RepID=A0A218ZI86_9HELO|nr:hypothetical protein B2J93_8996 [Marssonina coronariae]
MIPPDGSYASGTASQSTPPTLPQQASTSPTTTFTPYQLSTLSPAASSSKAAVLASLEDTPLTSSASVSPSIIASIILGGLMILSLLILLSYMVIQLRAARQKHDKEHEEYDVGSNGKGGPSPPPTGDGSSQRGGFGFVPGEPQFDKGEPGPPGAMGAATATRSNGAVGFERNRKRASWSNELYPLDLLRPAMLAESSPPQANMEMRSDHPTESEEHGHGHGYGHGYDHGYDESYAEEDKSPHRWPLEGQRQQGHRHRDSDLSLSGVRAERENILIGIGSRQESAGQTPTPNPGMRRTSLPGSPNSAHELRRPPPATAPMVGSEHSTSTSASTRDPAPARLGERSSSRPGQRLPFNDQSRPF